MIFKILNQKWIMFQFWTKTFESKAIASDHVICMEKGGKTKWQNQVARCLVSMLNETLVPASEPEFPSKISSYNLFRGSCNFWKNCAKRLRLTKDPNYFWSWTFTLFVQAKRSKDLSKFTQLCGNWVHVCILDQTRLISLIALKPGI